MDRERAEEVEVVTVPKSDLVQMRVALEDALWLTTNPTRIARINKAILVCFDLLGHVMTDEQRQEIREQEGIHGF